MIEVPPQPAWFEHAECAGIEPDLFFPRRGDMATLAEAKKVCHRCPVRLQCLDYALTNGETYGVFGGKSERERRRMRRIRNQGLKAS